MRMLIEGLILLVSWCGFGLWLGTACRMAVSVGGAGHFANGLLTGLFLALLLKVSGALLKTVGGMTE